MDVRLIEGENDNMKYEYNGNLLECDRINLVINEIVNKYPLIDINKAKEVAMLEGKISIDKNVEMQFNRLYNIMLVTQDNKQIVKDVYVDLVELLKNNKNDGKIRYYSLIALNIANFLTNQREFPYLDEF